MKVTFSPPLYNSGYLCSKCERPYINISTLTTFHLYSKAPLTFKLHSFKAKPCLFLEELHKKPCSVLMKRFLTKHSFNEKLTFPPTVYVSDGQKG